MEHTNKRSMMKVAKLELKCKNFPVFLELSKLNIGGNFRRNY